MVVFSPAAAGHEAISYPSILQKILSAPTSSGGIEKAVGCKSSTLSVVRHCLGDNALPSKIRCIPHLIHRVLVFGSVARSIALRLLTETFGTVHKAAALLQSRPQFQVEKGGPEH